MSAGEYYCAVCNARAEVSDGVVVRSCAHLDSAVIAPRSSMLYGQGGAKVSKSRAVYDAILNMVLNR